MSHMTTPTRGRKPKPVTLATRKPVERQTVAVRLDPATVAALDAYAEAQGVDRSTAVREAIAQLTGHAPEGPAYGWRRGVANG